MVATWRWRCCRTWRLISAATEAGLRTGDLILAVDGFAVRGFEDFQRLIATAPERQVTIVIERDGRTENVVAVPRAESTVDTFGNTHRVGRMGVLHLLSRATTLGFGRIRSRRSA